MKPKTLSPQAVIGQQGINLIESIVLEMGCRWVPAPSLDVGIDGYIELVDPTTHAALGVVLSVQSRATESRWTGEDDHAFRYICGERELDYWLRGNSPVLLILSRPSTSEAYWVSIKDYFQDLSSRERRQIVFDKGRDRFSRSSLQQLMERGARQDSGLYLAPPPHPEVLVSNLLTVRGFAPTVYVADTTQTDKQGIWATLREAGYRGGGEWFPKEHKLFSFLDLRDPPWPEVVDRGSMDEFDASEWAASNDPDRIRDFVRLLNAALRELLYPNVRFHEQEKVFAFTAGPGMRERRISTGRGPGRLVFSEYWGKRSHRRVAYRHLAFESQFRRFEGQWFLEVLPTYRFTTDGKTAAGRNGEYITSMKRLERNEAVLANLLVWANFMTRPAGLFGPPYPFLSFGGLCETRMDVGIIDAAWMADAEAGFESSVEDSDEGIWS
jgi:hypothetical protein